MPVILYWFHGYAMKQKTLTVLVSLAVAGIAAMGAAQDMKKSLYEKIGIHKIAAAADYCIDWETSDAMLLKNPQFKMAVASAPKTINKFGLTAYLAHLAGGPQVATFNIAAFDKAFMLTKAERDHAWMIRQKACEKAGFTKSEFTELKGLYLKMFDKAEAMAPTMEKFADENSLYARLGGIVPITMVVNDFVDMLAGDATIMANKNVVKSLTSGKVTAAGLKYLVCEQLAMASGGPYKYTGRSMKDSHKDLMISEKEWESAAGILKKVLDNYKVPAKEQSEIFTVIASTHGDIVKK